MMGAASGADAYYTTSMLLGKEGRGYTRGQVEKQINWLGAMALMLRSVPGRKNIIYLSEGFDARMIQGRRSEEHTSELQSLRHLVCRLLLEKKKQKRLHTTQFPINRQNSNRKRPTNRTRKEERSQRIARNTRATDQAHAVRISP